MGPCAAFAIVNVPRSSRTVRRSLSCQHVVERLDERGRFLVAKPVCETRLVPLLDPADQSVSSVALPKFSYTHSVPAVRSVPQVAKWSRQRPKPDSSY